jgi:hypothetical protein
MDFVLYVSLIPFQIVRDEITTLLEHYIQGARNAEGVLQQYAP